MNYEALAQQFWRDGYLALEDFFDSDLMDQYQELIVRHFGSSPVFLHTDEFLNKSATEVIPWFPQKEGENAFDVVENDPRLKALTEALLGEGWYSLYCMTMFSRKGTKGQAWHQDCDPEESASRFNVNRLIYTDDIREEVGGQTLVVPGSHRRGTITVGEVNEEFADQVVLTPKKGTLVMLHGHTWHRVRPVVGGYRVSTNYRCCPQGTPEDITDVCVYRNMRYKFATSSVVEDRLAGGIK
ncbi:phytanoyl-CoA dioxygenase family protein [Gilvimarinus sp. SDUM040013]|uniref:Phytanoyl-CoA dioxygenase family protein n=1 Tax=Gilvimarinus gilvus TaxID=3058038 RepID=A0ABU4S430_9GAMM|nr:phytanoyl-CoA dioxygenase family protein [Gilvimarinus sp. SDUM040013]MDO3385899.1 phytanoyl-CoA dioxygenase family protein [Gilvimarinus sp. SDUM040013]MDX6850598.1 phytanoyl-CoA dioxygenase family protein [Gilvimarinus sp. SDUM040013]